MPMSEKEQQVITNVIARLRCESGGCEEVHNALKAANAHGYLETWVIGALSCLLSAQAETGYRRKELLHTAIGLSN